MTGPEHFAEAERLTAWVLDDDNTCSGCGRHAPEARAEAVGLAQVHATLAGVYAHNRATTELTGLLQAMLDQIREFREGQP